MQPVSGNDWYKLSGTAAGTTTIMSREGVLEGIYVGTTTTGTATFYDNTDGGTSLPMFTAINNSTVSTNTTLHARVRKGLSAVVGGTVDMFVIYN